MLKAALIDLDGTMVRAHLELTSRVRSAVRRLAQRIPVSIVSSRDHILVRRFSEEIGLSALQISEGGARIFDPATGETPWFKTFRRDDAEEITKYLDQHGHAYSGVDGDRAIDATAEIQEWRVSRITAISLTPERAKEIAAVFGDMPEVHTSLIVRIDNGDWMVDFTHAEATKETAVVRYAELMGIDASEVAGIGDSYNDLPLLNACGLRPAGCHGERGARGEGRGPLHCADGGRGRARRGDRRVPYAFAGRAKRRGLDLAAKLQRFEQVVRPVVGMEVGNAPYAGPDES